MSTDVVKYEPKAPAKNAHNLGALLNMPSVQLSMRHVIPKHLTPERLVKTALIAASRQPRLLECTQESLLKAVMTSAELGLDCSGTTGRAYLVPFRNGKTNCTEATFIAGYLGLVDLARNSGDLRSIRAEVVYQQDQFEIEKGLEEKLIHKPSLEHDYEDKDIIGAYMIARLKDGGHHIHYMSRKEIEKIRARSKAKDSGPWVTDYAAMCKKTCIRGGVKFLPLSIETQQSIAKLDESEFIEREIRPEPQRATINIEDITPGNVETHQAVDEHLFPALPKHAEMAHKSFVAQCQAAELTEDMIAAVEGEMFVDCEIGGWTDITSSKEADRILKWITESMLAVVNQLRR